jgi:hypothetical protein
MWPERSRFLASVAAMIAGGTLCAAVFAFGGGTSSWIASGVAAAVLVVALAAFAMRGVGAAARMTDTLLAIAAAWTLLATRVFASALLVKWMAFAGGAGFALLGCGGLIAHEMQMERRLGTAVRAGLARGHLAGPMPTRTANGSPLAGRRR